MKYLFIETWNGEGYSESKSEIIETENPLQLAKSKANEAKGDFGALLIEKNVVRYSDGDNFEDSENYGAVHFMEYPENLLAVLIEPDFNGYQLLTNQEDLDSIIDYIKENSEEYEQEEEVFGFHHTDNGSLILEDYRNQLKPVEVTPDIAIKKWMFYAWNFHSKEFQINDRDTGNTMYLPTVFEALESSKMFYHLVSKWVGIANKKGGTQGLLEFYFELDESNRKLMVEWVINNYKG